jgi:hypothetical protein
MTKGDLYETSKNILKANTDVNLFRIKTFFAKAPLTDSLDSYFFCYGENIIWAFNKRKKELTTQCIYLLLNYYQTLKLYIKKFPTDNYDSVKAKYEEVFKYIYKNKLLEDNLSLIGFWNVTNPDLRYDDNFEIKELGVAEKKFIASKLQYDKDKAIKQFPYDPKFLDENLTDLKLVISYMAAAKQNKIDEYLTFLCDDLTRPLNYGVKYFIKDYEISRNCAINGNDIDKLNKMDDAELRNKIADILINIDNTSLRREKGKQHSGYEISDMDIPFYIGSEMYHLCIPVKSGQEIKISYVKEEIAYQIYKPFSYLGNRCIVLFITAKRCSQPLDSYIKRMSAHIPWHVEILQAEDLCKVFKHNNLL